MKKKMFYIFLTCFLPLTNAEVTSTVQPTSDQKAIELTTKQTETANDPSNETSFKLVTDQPTNLQPRTDASKILNAAMKSATSTPFQNMPNLDTTTKIYVTNNVQTEQLLITKQPDIANDLSNETSFKPVTDQPINLQPRTDASKILNETMKNATSALVTSIQNTTNLDPTPKMNVTNNVQTLAQINLTTPEPEINAHSTFAVQESQKLSATTTSKMDATTNSAQSTVVNNNDTPNSIIQSGEISNFTTNSTETTISTGISSTISLFSSSHTTQMKEETTLFVEASETTTKVYPTAKLSATTQNAPTEQKTTTQLLKTSNASEPFMPIPSTIDEIDKETQKDRDKAVKHGKIVAGIIGGALLLMMLGFLVILYKKHKLKKHQIETSDWAGPTPFMEQGGDNGHVTLRSSNRISLTSFLPQRLSKRLSLLPEVGEEMQELTPGITFGGKKEEKVKEKNDKKLALDANDNSENLTQTQEIILVDETSQKNGKAKLNEGETTKDKETENGQIPKIIPDIVQVQTNEDVNGQSENTQIPKDPPQESNNDKTEVAESNGPTLV